MELIHDMIMSMPSQINCKGFCRSITEGLQEFYDYKGMDYQLMENHAEQRLTASCVVFSMFHQEIWMIGDCQCIVDGTLYDNPKPSEREMAVKRSRYIKEALTHGKKTADFQENDEGRQFILQDLIVGCQQQNKTYAVFDGTPVYMGGVRMIPCQGCNEVVLASDGYPFLKSTLRESEQALKELLDTDPLCIDRYLATKGVMKGNNSFDDRAYVRFKKNKEKNSSWLSRWWKHKG